MDSKSGDAKPMTARDWFFAAAVIWVMFAPAFLMYSPSVPLALGMATALAAIPAAIGLMKLR